MTDAAKGTEHEASRPAIMSSTVYSVKSSPNCTAHSEHRIANGIEIDPARHTFEQEIDGIAQQGPRAGRKPAAILSRSPLRSASGFSPSSPSSRPT